MLLLQQVKKPTTAEEVNALLKVRGECMAAHGPAHQGRSMPYVYACLHP
jgi:hypothetical protein